MQYLNKICIVEKKCFKKLRTLSKMNFSELCKNNQSEKFLSCKTLNYNFSSDQLQNFHEIFFSTMFLKMNFESQKTAQSFSIFLYFLSFAVGFPL